MMVGDPTVTNGLRTPENEVNGDNQDDNDDDDGDDANNLPALPTGDGAGVAADPTNKCWISSSSSSSPSSSLSKKLHQSLRPFFFSTNILIYIGWYRRNEENNTVFLAKKPC